MVFIPFCALSEAKGMDINMKDIFCLSGKNALVTGGMGDIGFAISKGLLDAGAIVSVFDCKKDEKSCKGINYFSVDLTNKEAVDECLRKFMEINGRIDILVNAAGITIPSNSIEYLWENWEKTIRVNLSAVFYLTKKVANEMISKKIKGSIINITSLSAVFGFPDNPAYVASKGGLKQLTKAMAYDLGKYGIRVNNIGPGYIKTNMTKKSWENLHERKIRSNHTILKRWGEPKELVGAVIFLASSASSYITGQDIYVDGGWTAKGI